MQAIHIYWQESTHQAYFRWKNKLIMKHNTFNFTHTLDTTQIEPTPGVTATPPSAQSTLRKSEWTPDIVSQKQSRTYGVYRRDNTVIHSFSGNARNTKIILGSRANCCTKDHVSPLEFVQVTNQQTNVEISESLVECTLVASTVKPITRSVHTPHIVERGTNRNINNCI